MAVSGPPPPGPGARGLSGVRLLAKSGIGVDGPYLLIAPPGNPAIRLDARLLDRIQLVGRSPTVPLAMAAASGVASLGAALSVIPGGVIACVCLAYLSHERWSEGRRRDRSRDLLLALGDLEVALHIADGPAAAKQVADQLAPYTRDAPIGRPEVYEDACRRRDAHVTGRGEAAARREVEQALTVGADLVSVRGAFLHVGEQDFHLDQVREYALRGANLPLSQGRLLQAAMGLLVVAAEERARAGEDVAALSRRIADYEAWTGRSAGR